MKKNYALLGMLLLAGMQGGRAQNHGELNIGDVRARFNSNGLIGADPTAGVANFEVPRNAGGMQALFAAGMWIKGITNDNQSRLAAMMYEGAGDGDYYPGPLTIDGSASTNEAMMAAYDHVWTVTREEVAEHLAYFNCLSDPNCDVNIQYPNGYTIPASILEWPAVNNESGFSTYQAPFIDFNADGNYEPADGDAPCILGDQALYFVFNDAGGPHVLTGSPHIGLEIQAMPFAFASGHAAVDQTVFVHYHLINRGTQTLQGTRIGMFNDFDLGCPDDDYAGTDAARNLSYVYNGDNVDEDCLGLSGYGNDPPAIGIVLLKGPLLDATGGDEPQADLQPAWNGTGFGDGIVDNERGGLSKAIIILRDGPTWANDPVQSAHFAGYLSGFWKDGMPLTYGGDGHEPGVMTDHIYPGTSDPLGVGTGGSPQSPWFEGGMPPFDRRTLIGTTAFTLEPGEHVDLLFAYVFARASGGLLSSVEALQVRVDSISEFADGLPIWNIPEESFQGDCSGASANSVEELRDAGQLHLFPVPSSDIVTLNAQGVLAGQVLTLRDATGRIMFTHYLVQGQNEMDITGLARGVYSAEVRSAKAHFTGRVVKQ
jgi:hypothetical protein